MRRHLRYFQAYQSTIRRKAGDYGVDKLIPGDKVQAMEAPGCISLDAARACAAEVFPHARDEGRRGAHCYVGDRIGKLHPEKGSMNARAAQEKIRACFRAAKPFRLELSICLSKDIARAEGAIELVECGGAKRAVGRSSQSDAVAGPEQERSPGTESVVALVRKGGEAAFNGRYKGRDAGVRLVVVPVIVATAESEQHPGMQTDGILHKGPKTLLTSARGN